MSAPRRSTARPPAEWLARARSALVLSRQHAPGVVLEDLCFQAQQAAEKALKAVCLREGIEFPLTHDIRFLVRLLADEGLAIPDAVRSAAVLADYAVAARYPSAAEPVTEAEYAEAVALADVVVAWAATQVE